MANKQGCSAQQALVCWVVTPAVETGVLLQVWEALRNKRVTVKMCNRYTNPSVSSLQPRYESAPTFSIRAKKLKLIQADSETLPPPLLSLPATARGHSTITKKSGCSGDAEGSLECRSTPCRTPTVSPPKPVSLTKW
ncbi:unnamed protein product [Pleuronectes platessa]|uniref:Uncharacterized protein n=1 Tax=Pleuronectes platessa TaxID=8262 RepID=A0A9N7VF80_PLEPL|nr:unnamed protein product [Pleuronectes platessa]